MNEVKTIRLNTAVTTSSSVYHTFATSAVSTGTQNYILLPSDKTSETVPEEAGKYSVFAIADWFLNKSEMTHKKLQKLCYYAQAWCYALKGYRLEDTDYQAWIHGPVSPALWEKFKSFEYDTIRIRGTANIILSDEDEKLLEDIWDTYGDSSGNSLEALSQRELPWLEARRGYVPGEKCNVVISPETMASFYRSIYCGD